MRRSSSIPTATASRPIAGAPRLDQDAAMTTTLHYASGSPYAWRVWLSLEHKGVPYELKTLSFDAGDLKTPAFLALNPRHRVPVLVDDGFALYGGDRRVRRGSLAGRA